MPQGVVKYVRTKIDQAVGLAHLTQHMISGAQVGNHGNHCTYRERPAMHGVLVMLSVGTVEPVVVASDLVVLLQLLLLIKLKWMTTRNT